MTLGALMLSVVLALVGYTFTELIETRQRVSQLEDALADQARLADFQSQLDALDVEVADTQAIQSDLTTGLKDVRSHLAMVVGTETGLVPVAPLPLIELARRGDASTLERRISELEGDVFSIHFCLRNVIDAIEFNSTYVTGCLLV